jgi:hypothetical protein
MEEMMMMMMMMAVIIIIIIIIKEKTCTLIDVAIPAARNVVQKEAEKKLKYQLHSDIHPANTETGPA